MPGCLNRTHLVGIIQRIGCSALVAAALFAHADVRVTAQELKSIEEEPAEEKPRTVPKTFDEQHDSPLGAQSKPDEAFAPPTQIPKLSAPENSTGPTQLGTPSTGAPGVAPVLPPLSAHPAGGCGMCDYWIVSSRCCNGANAPCEPDNCLRFFHRRSERCVDPVPREAFHASLRPDQPVCFVVHGSYNDWKDVLSESWNIHRWLRSAAPYCPIQFVFFTWPSNGNPLLFPVDIAVLGRRSSEHGVFLAQVVSNLPPGQPVSLVGHSHGARTVVAAMHLLGGGAIEGRRVAGLGPNLARPLRAVLIAAAIDHDWFNPGERYDKALFPPERVLVMRNSRDGWLTVYPLRKGISERSLGKGGLGQDDRFALDALNHKIVELNTAEFTGIGHAWSHYYRRPELATALVPYTYFQEDQPVMGGPASLLPGPALNPATPIQPGTPPGATGPVDQPAVSKRSLPSKPASQVQRTPRVQPTDVTPVPKKRAAG